jgi:PAS domain S-box-containing protein
MGDAVSQFYPEPSLERLLEGLPLALLRLDRDLRYRYLSGSAQILTGWAAERLVGRSPREAALPEEPGASLEAAGRDVLATGEPRRLEFGLDTPAGPRQFECQLLPERDAHGILVSVLGILTDVSERKRVEDDLRASEERYRTLIAQVKNYAIFALDLEGRPTTWNEGVERVLGWPREEFLGLSRENLFSPEDVAHGAHRSELQHAAEEGSVTTDRWLRRKDGTPFFASGMTSRLVDAAGHVIGFSEVLRDRTAWKLAQDEHDLLLESERKARQQAEQANRLKDEFLATLSHELRSPLNAIVGWVHVLRRHTEANPEIVRGLDVIERNARGQAQIVTDLLDMSRIMAGKVRLTVRPLSLAKVITAAVETVCPAADAKGIRVETHLDPQADQIWGDANRLQQVIWNLLTNAVKFTPGGGVVEVSVARVDSQVELSVKDSGVGIHPGFLPFVFDSFRQADASTTRLYGGLGLGLSIVKHLVELHGGSVRATSAGEGHGATFVVCLPRPAPDAELEGAHEHSRTATLDLTAGLPTLSGITALVVDDEADSLVFCGRLLEDRGARILLAVDAQQALEILRSEAVDILISDIGMANEDGYYLIAQLRGLTEEHNARIPAIAVTAYARAEDRQRLLLAGYQMHISKPIEPQELVAGIASLVGVTVRKDPPVP